MRIKAEPIECCKCGETIDPYHDDWIDTGEPPCDSFCSECILELVREMTETEPLTLEKIIKDNGTR